MTHIIRTKSCKGKIINDEYEYDVTELLRNYQYEDEKDSKVIENTFIKTLLQGLKHIGYNDYNDGIVGLVCETELHNIIKRSEKKFYPHVISTPKQNDTPVICQISNLPSSNIYLKLKS